MPRIKQQPTVETESETTQVEVAAPTKAKNRPVVVRKMTESQEQKVCQDGVREFNDKNELPHTTVEPPYRRGKDGKPQGIRGQQWMDDMVFANEMVTVMVHESTDKLANPFPEVWVNGRVQRFVRGNEQQVRRCFVEKLARMKLTAFDSQKTKDVDGEDVYRYPARTGLLYPFVLINPTAKDTEWLKAILAES